MSITVLRPQRLYGWDKDDPTLHTYNDRGRIVVRTWRKATPYERGEKPPHYPVPAIYDESLHGYILSGSSWSDLDWLNAIDYWLTVRPSFDNNA